MNTPGAARTRRYGRRHFRSKRQSVTDADLHFVHRASSRSFSAMREAELYVQLHVVGCRDGLIDYMRRSSRSARV